MELEMESMASAIGLTVPGLYYLLCLIATIPIGAFWRLVPGGSTGKHLYSTFTGVLLSYFCFGYASILHYFVPMLLTYTSMLFYRKRCGIISFFLALGYLIACHAYYMSGTAMKEGDFDATGGLMIITLKLISLAINYNDGLLKEDNLREAQKRNRMIKVPSLIEYTGYCLCCGIHIVGPVHEMQDYLEWSEKKGIWKDQSPPFLLATLKAILQAGFCLGLYLYLEPLYSLSRFTDPVYQEYGFLKRLSYQYMAAFTFRWRFYFLWSISEASIIVSGLGFSGWTNSSPAKPKWDRAKNIDILGFELAKSSAHIPLVWNIQVSTWLRHYVYERLIQKGKKPGFFQLFATMFVSAIWHKLYPGFMIFFAQLGLMIAGSRVLYRWQQAVPGMLKNIFVLANFVYTLLALNTSLVSLMLLNLDETLAANGSVYYIGTVIPVVLILLGKIINPKPYRPKVWKEL